MKHTTAILVSVLAMLGATPTLAASDMHIKFEGVDGETSVTPVEGWSFGTCNAGQCTTIKSPRDTASGQATGKRQHGVVRVQASQNTQSLRESPTRASAARTAASGSAGAAGGGGGGAGGQLNVASGDVDGDGRADLAFATNQTEVTSFSLIFQQLPAAERARLCTGKHFAKAVLRSGSDEFEITNGSASCTGDGPVKMTISGGQMKHTKSGHVTLLK